MRIVVLGAGLLGLSSAYFLCREGHAVTVIDSRAGPGQGTSFANAGVLAPGHTDPWNAPGIFFRVLGWLGREDAPFLLRPRALPSLLNWGPRFLWHSQTERHRRSWLLNMRLAQANLVLLEELRKEHDLQFDQAQRGTIKLFRDAASAGEASQWLDFFIDNGVPSRWLNPDETVDLEPSLKDIRQSIAGALYHPMDQHGDAYLFCQGLKGVLEEGGVQFEWGQPIRRIATSGNAIRSVHSATRDWSGDAFVLAAGSHSSSLARPLGLSLPIRPVKGYSITVDLAQSSARPRQPVVDEEYHIALTPLGDRLRIGGTAELAGLDERVRNSRIENLLRSLERVYPAISAGTEPEAVQPWAGLRPVTVDGLPLIGATPIPNLYLNTGHGTLGWTHCLASAQILADQIAGRKPFLPGEELALGRFRTHWRGPASGRAGMPRATLENS